MLFVMVVRIVLSIDVEQVEFSIGFCNNDIVLFAVVYIKLFSNESF